MPSFSLNLSQPTAMDSDIPGRSTAIVPIYLPAEPDDPAVATRTRSHKEIATPPPPNAESKLVKNYRMTAALKALSASHKFMVDDNWKGKPITPYQLLEF